MPIDPQLLEILACPGCKHGVSLLTEEGREKLVCQNPECGLKYPVREGIPVMLLDEAEGPPAVKDRYK